MTCRNEDEVDAAALRGSFDAQLAAPCPSSQHALPPQSLGPLQPFAIPAHEAPFAAQDSVWGGACCEPELFSWTETDRALCPCQTSIAAKRHRESFRAPKQARPSLTERCSA